MKEKRFQKIYVEITNICNLKCKFCPDSKREKQFMKCEEFEQILKKIKPYTNLIYLHVKGEPLLHPELKELLSLCEKYEIYVNITTNATLLLKNIQTIINSKAIRQMNLSLHSVSQNNQDEQYNTKMYLENIMTATKRIYEETDILISYRLWNLEDIKQNEKNKEIIHRLEKEYNILDLIEKAKENKAIKLEKRTYLNQDIQFTWPNINGKIISEIGKCFGLRNQIAILVNGDIVPCCLDQEGDIILGNIYKNELEEILNSEKARKIIQGFEGHKLVHPLCKRCGFRTRFGNN